MTGHSTNTRPNKTDAGNGSKAICRVSNVLRSPSPDPKRSWIPSGEVWGGALGFRCLFF
jgi:hypothetical protein